MPHQVSDGPHPGNAHAVIDPLLRDRWSTRLFDPVHELFDDELTRLFEAARWAPSAGNSQPWAFVVGRRDDPTHRLLCGLLSRGNTSWAPQASALVVTLHQATDEWGGGTTLSDYAQYDLGQAVAHLSVQAASMGLFTHQFAGFDHDGVATGLRVPEHWRVTTMVAIGQRATPEQVAEAPESLRSREQEPRVRKEFAESVFGAWFGSPYGL
ncbi:MAG: Nitroreductase [Nocardioidaceae bacterium]|nr:Nitroreductase [Nocardioidaceae bacterium]